MRCAFCGEGDRWIKTCCSKDGSRLRICNPCFKVLRLWLTIVPGDGVVTARYEGCERTLTLGRWLSLVPVVGTTPTQGRAGDAQRRLRRDLRRRRTP